MPEGSQGVYEALKKLFVTDKDGHIIVDSIGTWGAVDITDDWTRQLGLVDLSRVLGAALAHTNPVIVRISDGVSAYLNPQTIRALTSADQVTIANASLAVTTDALKATDLDLQVTTKHLGVDVQNLPATYPDTTTEPRNVSQWGGTALTGRDISSDLAYLQPPSSIGTLADVTAAASATQLTATSTACQSVIVRSLAANTGKIRVGDSNITASRGAEISAGDAIILDIDNVNKVYVYGNASDKVSVTYVT